MFIVTKAVVLGSFIAAIETEAKGRKRFGRGGLIGINYDEQSRQRGPDELVKRKTAFHECR
jgi:hypothetical protein